MKKIIFSILAISMTLSACSLIAPEDKNDDSITKNNNQDINISEDNKTNNYIDLSPDEAKKLIENNSELIIIDVSPNYAKGHLPGAINYYVGDGSLDKAIPNLDKQATYLVYCHVDSAAILGAQKLIDAGFKNVYRLEGNYSAWVEAGYDIEK